MRNRRRTQLQTLFVLFGFLALAADAGAVEYVPEKKKIAKIEKPQGVSGKLNLGANVSLGSNHNVVGQQDGASLTIGGTVSSGMDYRRGRHEWRNTLDLKESFTRTPTIPQMVKSADELRFESIYLFRPKRLPWLGPFARFVLDTPIFEGRDVREGSTDYITKGSDPTDPATPPLATQVSELKLTRAFSPLTLKQSLGAFAKPIEEEPISVEIRLGFGGMEVFAEDQLAIADDDATPDHVDVILLGDTIQAGAEFTLTAGGSFQGGKVTYKAGAEFLVPFINNAEDSDDRSAFELTNIELLAKISFKLVSWASLDYEFKAVRKPQLIDEFQLQNNLLLTFSYSLVHPKPAPKEEPKK